MSTFFHEGGFGMFPTLAFGLLLVIASVVYAVRPERRFVPLLASLGVVTLGSGGLGFTMGVIRSLQFASGHPAGERGALAMLGTAESAHNVVLALIAVVMAAVAASIGVLRGARVSAR